MILSKGSPAKKPKKKRERPKGSTKKPKKPALKKPKVESKLPEPKKDEVKPATSAIQLRESYSDKYTLNRIFRREMGEPEFWIGKDGLDTMRPLRSQDQEREISRKVLIPTDQTPPYQPAHVLSPEFEGTSNYERGVVDLKQELEEKLQHLKDNSDSNPQQIIQTQEELKTLDCLYDNFYSGMNVFRTAKGGRDKLRE